MVTIIIPVSRKDYLKRLFGQLELLFCDPEQTNLLVYVDGDLNLYEKARNYTVASKFNEKLCVYRKKGLPNVGHMASRRRRIAEIHNEIKTNLNYTPNYDYVYLIEDDTLVPPNSLEILMKGFEKHPKAAFISGVELGRWGFLHVGAWEVDNIEDPSVITSLPEMDDLVEVDAAGLYCCLMKMDVYMDHKFEPFEKILGPDFDMGLKLRQKGYRNYVDFSVPCIHMDKKEDIDVAGDIIQVRFTRQSNGWKLEDLGTKSEQSDSSTPSLDSNSQAQTSLPRG